MNRPKGEEVALPEPMNASADGLFDFHQLPSFTSRYLDTFYRDRPPTNDERVVLRFLVTHARAMGPVGTLLEVGCGPTVHHMLPFVPYAADIHMADYLPENLAEIRRWQTDARHALDWRQYAELVVGLERGATSDTEVVGRETAARRKIRRLLRCDIRQEHILGADVSYPAVAAFYCTEEVGITISAWERVMGHLARVVAPGGYFFLTCLRNTNFYLVGENQYPCAPITEADVLRVLPALGFDMDRTVVEGTAISDQEREGLFGVILVAARKRR